MKIKKLFVNMIILILGNYRDFSMTTPAGAFNTDAYLKSMASESQPFYKRFAQSQVFNDFIKSCHDETSIEIAEFNRYMDLVMAMKPTNQTQDDTFQIDSDL